jgi:hypothetical protein
VFQHQDDSGVAAGSVGKEALGDGLQEHGGGAQVWLAAILVTDSVDTHVDKSDVNTSL